MNRSGAERPTRDNLTREAQGADVVSCVLDGPTWAQMRPASCLQQGTQRYPRGGIGACAKAQEPATWMPEDPDYVSGVGMSRRQLLLGGGCVAVAVAAGIGAADVFDHPIFERGLYRLGLMSSPSIHLPDSGAIERSGTFPSRYMNGPVGWTVSHPPGSQPLEATIFCLHGYHNNHRFAFDAVHVPDAAAFVGLRVAVAAVDGGADSYWHARIDGTDALAMLLEEFVPRVRGMVGDLPQALMGWSMGGYGALLAAERARSQFVAVAPASPAIWLEPRNAAPGAFDSPTEFYANDIFTNLDVLRGMGVAVACGTGDPFYAATRDLVQHMDFPHSDFFGPGFHDAPYWESVAPDQLRAIAPTFTCRGERC